MGKALLLILLGILIGMLGHGLLKSFLIIPAWTVAFAFFGLIGAVWLVWKAIK